MSIALKALLMLGVLAALHHAAYLLASRAGVFCTPSTPGRGAPKPPEKEPSAESAVFDLRQVCWASGLSVKEGVTYDVELRMTGAWFDQTIRTDVGGYPTRDLKHFVAFPLKRWWSANWFQPVLRVGVDEYVLDPVPLPRVEYERYGGKPVARFKNAIRTPRPRWSHGTL